MPRQKKKPGTALATVSATSLDVKTITRAQANEMLKARALERFHEDRDRRESNIREFEAEFGRSDRIDAALLNDLQKLQVRLAAVAARQTRLSARKNSSRVWTSTTTSVGMAKVSARRGTILRCSRGTRSSRIRERRRMPSPPSTKTERSASTNASHRSKTSPALLRATAAARSSRCAGPPRERKRHEGFGCPGY